MQCRKHRRILKFLACARDYRIVTLNLKVCCAGVRTIVILLLKMNEMISSDETSDEEQVFRNFDVEAQLIVRNETLPKKSADRYILAYDAYKAWEDEHRNSLSSSSESNLIVYFKDLSSKLKPSTLWSMWSMLKKH